VRVLCRLSSGGVVGVALLGCGPRVLFEGSVVAWVSSNHAAKPTTSSM
jgi:hypothetical protein